VRSGSVLHTPTVCEYLAMKPVSLTQVWSLTLTVIMTPHWITPTRMRLTRQCRPSLHRPDAYTTVAVQQAHSFCCWYRWWLPLQGESAFYRAASDHEFQW